jgi:polyhydroxyalkanoate synthase subunit PhaC
MPETSESFNPLENWTKLVDNALGGYPATQVIARAAQDGKDREEPWVAFMDRLWEANPYSTTLPIDPGDTLSIFQKIWLDALKNPMRVWSRYGEFVQQYTQLMATTTLKLWGLGKDSKPLIEPEKGDKRFSFPDWQQNPVFDAIKQSYLLTAETLLKMTSDIEGLDAKQQRTVLFYLRQALDALSPTNFVATNPQVLHETMATGGQNLVQGMEHLIRDIGAGEMKITDTEAFHVGQNLATTPGEVVFRNKMIELLQYTPTTEKTYSIPLLFIPPWINKFYILDLQPYNSMVKFLVDQGFTVFVISWKNPDPSMSNVSFDDYVELGPVTALKVVKEITGSPKVNAIGYCIAGTMLSTVPAYLESIGDDSINSLTFVVTLLDFEEEPTDMTMFLDEPAMKYVEKQMSESGVLDSRSMASMFRMLRANDLIWSNFVNNYLLGKEPAAFDLLFWNNDGTRMTQKAHSFYLRSICMENNLIVPNKISVKGIPVDLGKIKLDTYAVGTQQDHIVPWKGAWRITQLFGGPVRFVLGPSGHIAGISTPPAKGRGYWTNDNPAKTADEWLATATRHQKSSWWADWVEWLKPRSGEQVTPPSMGSATYPPITPAPGTYVLEK